MYSIGKNWKGWMQDYRYGTLVFLPKGEVQKTCNKLRVQYDPVFSKSCASHITITQPFSFSPDKKMILRIEDLLKSISSFNIQIGPAITTPNKQLIWLDASPKPLINSIRDKLHELEAFRLDLPFTKGFIPHLTISESEREPREVKKILENLNLNYQIWNLTFESVSWFIPDDNFIFREHRVFSLKEN